MPSMLDISVDLTGDKKLIRALFSLPDKVHRRVVKRGVRMGMTPVKREWRKNIEAAMTMRTRKLRRSVKHTTVSGRGYFTAVVGPSYKIAPHAHLPERGTVKRKTESGKSTGKMPVLPHGAPTFRSSGSKARDIIMKQLWVGVKREIAKSA